MVIPVLSQETALTAPEPESAMRFCSGPETEGMYVTDAVGHFRFENGRPVLNLKNRCLHMEYDMLRSRLRIGMGHAVPEAEKARWTMEMIRKYDPDMWAWIEFAQAMGRVTC